MRDWGVQYERAIGGEGLFDGEDYESAEPAEECSSAVEEA